MVDATNESTRKKGVDMTSRSLIVKCPVCLGASEDGSIKCDACGNVGELKLIDRGDGICEYRTLDDHAIVGSEAFPRPAKFTPVVSQQFRLQELEEHLESILALVRNTMKGNRLYLVSISYRSALDGEKETGKCRVWAKDASEAGYLGTHNAARHQWAHLEGTPTLIEPTPTITEEMLEHLYAVNTF